MLVDRYLVVVYIIPDKADELEAVIRQVVKMDYGKYESVYFKSCEGVEYYINPDEKMVKAEGNKSVVIEFSMDRNDELLGKVLKQILEVHPWREPVIRVVECVETRTGK